jgi:hypothetical protein
MRAAFLAGALQRHGHSSSSRFEELPDEMKANVAALLAPSEQLRLATALNERELDPALVRRLLWSAPNPTVAMRLAAFPRFEAAGGGRGEPPHRAGAHNGLARALARQGRHRRLLQARAATRTR